MSGRSRRRSAASELAKLRGLALPDGLPAIDVAAVAAAQAAVRDAVRAGALSSAHDVAEGGLAVALAECCLAGGLGAEVELGDDALGAPPSGDGAFAALFGEGAGGFLLSGPASAIDELAASGVDVRSLGAVGGERLSIAGVLDVALEELAAAHASLAELFR